MIRSLLIRAGALAAAALVSASLLVFTSSGFAADQRSVFQGLNGMPAHGVQVLRDSFGKVYLTMRVNAISTASNLTNPSAGQVVIPVKGKITSIYMILAASVAGTLTDAESALVASLSSTGEITGGSITIAASTVEGASDSATPTGANSVVAGDILEIQSDGRNSALMDAVIVIEIDRDV